MVGRRSEIKEIKRFENNTINKPKIEKPIQDNIYPYYYTTLIVFSAYIINNGIIKISNQIKIIW